MNAPRIIDRRNPARSERHLRDAESGLHEWAAASRHSLMHPNSCAPELERQLRSLMHAATAYMVCLRIWRDGMAAHQSAAE